MAAVCYAIAGKVTPRVSGNTLVFQFALPPDVDLKILNDEIPPISPRRALEASRAISGLIVEFHRSRR